MGRDFTLYLNVLLSYRGPRQCNRYSDSLRAGRSGDQILVGVRFSTPIQIGPRAHMGTGPLSWHWPPTPIQCRGQRKTRAIPLLPSRPSWSFIGQHLPYYRTNSPVTSHLGLYTTLKEQYWVHNYLAPITVMNVRIHFQCKTPFWFQEVINYQ